MSRKSKLLSFILVILCSFCFTSCESEDVVFMPKPRGFFRIELPEPKYNTTSDTLPYFFEYSSHAELAPDSSHLAEPYWIEIYYKDLFHANLDVSYKRIESHEQFKDLINDVHELANKHGVKAYAIEEKISHTKDGNTVIMFELEGEVPSPFQFVVTDSTKHFLRADLYFPSNTKNDSIAPLIKYIKKDMKHMIETMKWNQDFKEKYAWNQKLK